MHDIVSNYYTTNIYEVKCRFYKPHIKEDESDDSGPLCGRWLHTCKPFKNIKGLSSHEINNCEGILKLDYIQYLKYKNIED